MKNIEKQINKNFKCKNDLFPRWLRCKTCEYYYSRYGIDSCLMREIRNWTQYKVGLER